MDEIISRLKDIELLMSTLDDNERDQFQNQITGHLADINQSINKIGEKISSYKPNIDKCKSVIAQNQRDKIVQDTIFPYYWFFSEFINNIDDDELVEQILKGEFGVWTE